MAVDLKQFHQVFIEESFEGLDSMENALMVLDADAIDSETINAIFRAAHSIKGGGATFGFSAIAGFTHVLETLLDQIRSGRRSLTASDINLFLQSVDCMREMLGLLQTEQNIYTASALELKAQFEAILNAGAPQNPSAHLAPPPDVQAAESAAEGVWLVEFIPGPDILRAGNCPLRLFTEMQKLGSIEVTAQSNVPKELHVLDAERCYLSWNIQLRSNCPESDLTELFEWVADDATIRILRLSAKHHGWQLNFQPNLDLLRTGNEPIRIFKELNDLAVVTRTHCNVSALPPLKLLDPENIHLDWTFDLQTDLTAPELLEVFDWVSEDAQITVQPLSNDAALNALEVAVASSSDAVVNTVSGVSPDLEAPRDEVIKTAKIAEPTKKANNSEASSIRVGIDKIDSLINMVGELVITQSMLGQLSNELDSTRAPKLLEGLNQLAQNTRELQESVMRIRMLPISFTFSRFPRMVRDLSQQLGKKIHLELFGENTELDKTVMEKIGDPLVHLVRNAVDHGIETPEERLAKGKPEEGRVVLNAYHQSGNVMIEIIDDGKGLDRERLIAKALEKKIISAIEAQNYTDEQAYDLIFQPGFSTANTVSDVSGRGVGMDVVKRNIQALNGVVEIRSTAGQGSKILIRLPLTLAILDGQLARVGKNIYIFPLVSIVESMQYKTENIRHIAGGCSVFRLREDFVPIVHLKDIFNIPHTAQDDEQPLMVVVEAEGEKVGVVVDELLAQQQVVIKSLEQNYRKVEGVSGATILGDGTVSLILDIEGLVRIAGVKQLQNLTVLEATNQSAVQLATHTYGSVLRH